MAKRTCIRCLHGLTEGNYLAGFRPNHLKWRKGDQRIGVYCKLQVTEINWLRNVYSFGSPRDSSGLGSSVKILEIGAMMDVFRKHVYIFAEDGVCRACILRNSSLREHKMAKYLETWRIHI
jgi:hypothetical protein